MSIYSTVPDNRYASYSGTSMATLCNPLGLANQGVGLLQQLPCCLADFLGPWEFVYQTRFGADTRRWR